MIPDELYRKALQATNPRVRAALLRAWHRAKTRPEGDTVSPADAPPSRYAAWCESLRACTACPLAQTRTQAVPGEGPIPADVMLLGEAPGEREDAIGRPFVGPAGKLLDELLASIGWLRSRVYLANVVSCRPPGNRAPKWEEVSACRHHVRAQLDLVRPRVVVTLGAHALAHFDDTRRISACHGSAFRAGGYWVFPCYHPAAALHKPELRRTLFADFQKLPGLMRSVKRPASRPLRSWEEAVQSLCVGRLLEVHAEALGETVYLAGSYDAARQAPESAVVYYPHELRALAGISPDELEAIHRIKSRLGAIILAAWEDDTEEALRDFDSHPE